MRNNKVEKVDVMYTLSRGPNKIAANTRRGPTTKPLHLVQDNLDSARVVNKHLPACGAMNSPRPVFNGKRMNLARPHNMVPTEPPSPQHEEMVRYLADTWQRVSAQSESCARQGQLGPDVYQEKDSNPQLEGFKAFDLEQWWGNRTLQKCYKN